MKKGDKTWLLMTTEELADLLEFLTIAVRRGVSPREAALEKAAQKRTTGPNPDPPPDNDKDGIGRRGG